MESLTKVFILIIIKTFILQVIFQVVRQLSSMALAIEPLQALPGPLQCHVIFILVLRADLLDHKAWFGFFRGLSFPEPG